MLSTEGVSELEAEVRRAPDDPLAAYYLAKRYFLSRRYARARDMYLAASRHDPTSARDHLGAGLCYYHLGKMREARDELARALRLDPKLAWAEYYLGKILYSEDDVYSALDHLQRAVILDPRSDQAWYSLAVCQIQLRRFAAALPNIQNAIARNDRDPRYYTSLGVVLVYLGKAADAEAAYQRALQLNPRYGPACALYGGYLLRNGAGPLALERARKYLERATQLPTFRPQDIYIDLGELSLKEGRPAAAIAPLKRAAQIDPTDERPYYTLTRVYRRVGDVSAASAAEARFKSLSALHLKVQTLESRVTQDPADPALRIDLARTYVRADLPAKALDQYGAYLRLRPNDTAVAREMSQLAPSVRPDGRADEPTAEPRGDVR